MKNIPLHAVHVALGAKMAEFGGYNMPISYTGVIDEHRTVRKTAGVFDISHMGELLISGPDALAFLQKITTNDVSRLTAGKAQYSCMLHEDGGIIDDLVIYCIRENAQYMLVVNASNIDKDLNWIYKQNTTTAVVKNISDTTCLFAIQGPEANKMMQPLTTVDLPGLRYYTFQTGMFAGVENVIISATGYTGSGGIEIYFTDTGGNPLHIWNEILNAGQKKGLKPVGLAARDTLRLEKGYCLYGNDIDDTTSPLEAGLGWIVKMGKNDFSGKAALAQAEKSGIGRRLVGIELLERGIPRKGFEIFDNNKKPVGRVTSGTHSISLNKPIALGYVTSVNTQPQTSLYVQIRDKLIKAVVVPLPFL